MKSKWFVSFSHEDCAIVIYTFIIIKMKTSIIVAVVVYLFAIFIGQLCSTVIETPGDPKRKSLSSQNKVLY